MTAAQQALAQATIVSPIAGTVAEVGLVKGGAVTVASTTAMVLVVGSGGYEATTMVPVAEIPHVRVGQVASVTPDGSHVARPRPSGRDRARRHDQRVRRDHLSRHDRAERQHRDPWQRFDRAGRDPDGLGCRRSRGADLRGHHSGRGTPSRCSPTARRRPLPSVSVPSVAPGPRSPVASTSARSSCWPTCPPRCPARPPPRRPQVVRAPTNVRPRSSAAASGGSTAMVVELAVGRWWPPTISEASWPSLSR